MAPRPRKTGSKDLPPNLYRKTDSRNGVTYYSYRDPVSGKWYGLGSDKAQAVREAVAAQEFWMGEERCLHKDGHLFPVRLM